MKVKFLIALFLGFFLQLSAQKYYIADVNFAEAIKATYPGVMSGDSLIISEASQITGYVSFADKNIENVDGIQFFTGADNLDVHANQIESLPDLTAFDQLKNLSCHRNKITQLPALPSGIEKIYAFDNLLTSIDALMPLSELIILHVSENQLTEIPSLSNFPALEQLHCDQNKIVQIKDLSAATELLYLFAWDNQLTEINGLSDNLKLQKLYINDNYLSTLPTLTNKPDMEELEVGGNYLTFEDLYPIFENSLLDTIINFSTMKPIVNERIVSAYDNQAFVLKSQVDRQLDQINYALYKNDSILIAENTTGTFSVPSADKRELDYFSVKISSDFVPGLVLLETKWTLKKENCADFLPDYLTVLNNDCSNGAAIKLLKYNDELITENVHYTFATTGASYELDAPSLLLENIMHGNYTLRAVYKDQCDLSKAFEVPNAPNCDKIFSPNDDGQNDTYFFDQAGEIKIYNIKGICVKTLIGPIVWDGTDDKAHIVPLGYYTIVVNEKDMFHLTVMK